jgi:hypothetical protein
MKLMARQKYDYRDLDSFCRESQNNRIKTGVRAFFHVDCFIFSFFS